MLLGAELHVHTYHKNLTFDNWQTQRVLRWRFYDEEYSLTIHYTTGSLNIPADICSRLGHQEDVTQPLVGKNSDNIDNVVNNENKGENRMKTSIS